MDDVEALLEAPLKRKSDRRDDDDKSRSPESSRRHRDSASRHSSSRHHREEEDRYKDRDHDRERDRDHDRGSRREEDRRDSRRDDERRSRRRYDDEEYESSSRRHREADDYPSERRRRRYETTEEEDPDPSRRSRRRHESPSRSSRDAGEDREHRSRRSTAADLMPDQDAAYVPLEEDTKSAHSAGSRSRQLSSSHRDDEERHYRSRSGRDDRLDPRRSHRDEYSSPRDDHRRRDHVDSPREDARRHEPRYEAPPAKPRTPTPPPMTEEEHEMRSVFVSQLAARIGDQQLHAFFENQAGPVREAKVIVDRISRRSKGVGYVEFMELETVQRALALSGMKVLGVPIQVQYTEAEKNRQASTAQSSYGALMDAGFTIPAGSDATPSGAVPYNVLYVGSLNYSLTADDMREVFTPFGAVASVDLQTDPGSGKSKGYCYVQFYKHVDAIHAREKMNGFQLAGRQLRISTISERNAILPPMSRSGPVALGDGEIGPNLNNIGRIELMQKLARTDAASNQPPPTVMRPNIPTAASRCILLKNMFDPAEETEPTWDTDLRDDVKEEIQSKYGAVAELVVQRDSTEGAIYLKMEDTNGAAKALSGLNGRWLITAVDERSRLLTSLTQSLMLTSADDRSTQNNRKSEKDKEIAIKHRRHVFDLLKVVARLTRDLQVYRHACSYIFPFRTLTEPLKYESVDIDFMIPHNIKLLAYLSNKPDLCVLIRELRINSSMIPPKPDEARESHKLVREVMKIAKQLQVLTNVCLELPCATTDLFSCCLPHMQLKDSIEHSLNQVISVLNKSRGALKELRLFDHDIAAAEPFLLSDRLASRLAGATFWLHLRSISLVGLWFGETAMQAFLGGIDHTQRLRNLDLSLTETIELCDIGKLTILSKLARLRIIWDGPERSKGAIKTFVVKLATSMSALRYVWSDTDQYTIERLSAKLERLIKPRVTLIEHETAELLWQRH
ncbi:uncharacterized protein L969DRAFT_105412 [Mixia osmundae IAM 14324]|uniref:RRM domain-containing protein n=1 Tax=Mixia osmundae (strain CBS 9802 / IAM 14324 / JCM 22182 / KY 12970) TaxID=764103 RepID=G7DZH9_MIXOS|nr:uncharacterized protein L969DRAFT_105412 [Mixia osmundae IAM 14324]KEI37158.1 hypothetical protein L969DRAFT_105412 [Mixia osmundae IAM 14324]GAA95989.1 hypothetical protein E5Q_02647 [Mixia osmundae IAM 14324]